MHEFNSPEENVSQYLTSIDPDYLSNKLSFKKYIKVTCVLLISTILIAVMSWNLFLYTARREFKEIMSQFDGTTIEEIQ